MEVKVMTVMTRTSHLGVFLQGWLAIEGVDKVQGVAELKGLPEEWCRMKVKVMTVMTRTSHLEVLLQGWLATEGVAQVEGVSEVQVVAEVIGLSEEWCRNRMKVMTLT